MDSGSSCSALSLPPFLPFEALFLAFVAVVGSSSSPSSSAAVRISHTLAPAQKSVLTSLPLRSLATLLSRRAVAITVPSIEYLPSLAILVFGVLGRTEVGIGSDGFPVDLLTVSHRKAKRKSIETHVGIAEILDDGVDKLLVASAEVAEGSHGELWCWR